MRVSDAEGNICISVSHHAIRCHSTQEKRVRTHIGCVAGISYLPVARHVISCHSLQQSCIESACL